MSEPLRAARPAGAEELILRPDTNPLARADTPAPPYAFLLPPVGDGELGRVGHYRVLRLIGAGGMGMVFAGEDIALARPVAIKVMRPDCGGGDPDGGWQRFLREARALAALKHPNLVTVYQAFQERGTIFLVMELLEGESLDAVIRRPEFPDPREVIRIGIEVATGLAALHESGLIHRDIKPANIFLESKAGHRSGVTPRSGSGLPGVKILDLGLVQYLNQETRLTEAGAIVGTPAYMSPEQARAKPLDHRTDLFSLGCVLYALCTGHQPFEADSPMAQAAALAADDPAPIREQNPDIPKPLADLIAELLAKNPDDRPASAAVVVERLLALESPVVVAGPPAAYPAPAPVFATDFSPAPETVRTSRTRRRKGRPAPRPSFARRHAMRLVAGLWLVVAVLVALAVAVRGDRPEAKATPDATPPAPAPAGKPPAPAAKQPEVVYLSEFPAGQRTESPARPLPPGFDGTIRVGDRVSPHGIFMHPAPPGRPPASITYKLGKGHTRFDAEVALNNTAPPFANPVRFVVYLDGKRRWESEPVRRGDKPRECKLDVTGVAELTLDVTTDGPPEGCHAVWIEPRLTK